MAQDQSARRCTARVPTGQPRGMTSEQGPEQAEQVTEQPARERPRWSAAEAARRCGVGRATIQRALTAGRIPGAEQTEAGWSIPLEGLLAAGFNPSAPTPPEDTAPPAREHDRAADEPVPEQARRIAELERELAEARRLADLERVRRESAEALAAERAERVVDLRQALRMLEAAPADRPQQAEQSSAPAPAPEPVQQPAPAAPVVPPRRRLLGWLRDSR